jgi:hypothetical protein
MSATPPGRMCALTDRPTSAWLAVNALAVVQSLYSSSNALHRGVCRAPGRQSCRSQAHGTDG